MTKPRILATVDERRTGLAATTWEQRTGLDSNGQRIRAGMPAAELIDAMGPLWVNHSQHATPNARVPKPPVRLPNLVHERPPEYDLPNVHSFWGLIHAIVRYFTA